jgi:hypothetical protein
VGTEFMEELGTRHNIPISAPFATLDTNYHALAIDVADLQVSIQRVVLRWV